MTTKQKNTCKNLNLGQKVPKANLEAAVPTMSQQTLTHYKGKKKTKDLKKERKNNCYKTLYL